MSEEDKYRSELLGVWNVSYGLDKLAKTLDWWPSGIVITDHRGVIVYANPSFLSMTGYKKLAEVVNKNIPTITDDAGAKMLGENCILVLGSEKKWGGKLSIKRVDGSLFDASVLCSYLPGPAGNAGNMLMDVHYLPHAGDAIESLSIYDRSRTGIAFYDHSGRLIGANKRCLEFFGVANESEISGFSLFEDPNYPEGNLQELAETGHSCFEEDYDYDLVKERKLYKTRRTGKSPLFVSITMLGASLQSEIGYIVHMKENRANAAATEPSKDKKKANDALEENEERYRQLVERANDGILIVQDNLIKYANSRLAEMLKGTMETIIGRPFTDFIHPDECTRVTEHYKRRLTGDSFEQVYETRILDCLGGTIPAELNAGMINYQKKPADMVFVRDIAKHKRIEENMGLELYKFKVLYEIAINMQEKTLDENLQFITDKSRELLSSDTAFICLYDEERKETYMHRSSGIKTDALKNARLPGGKGMGWHIMQNNKGYIIEDYTKENAREGPIDGIIAEEGLVSGIGVPIRGEHESLGVLCVCNRMKTQFTEYELATLMLLGNLAAIEINNKKSQQALLESKQHMEDIINFLPDATLVIDKRGKVTAWNKAIENLTGIKAEDMIGRGDYEYGKAFYGKTRPLFIDLVGKSEQEIRSLGYTAVSMQGDTLFGETVAEFKGKETRLWLKTSPIYDNKGRLAGVIESMRDITSRRAVEDALKDRNALLNSVINSAKDTSIFALDRDYHYVAYNENHRRDIKEIYGKDIEIGKSALDYVTIPEEVQSIKTDCDRVLRGESFTETYHREIKDRWHELSWNPTMSEDGKITGINVFTKDISERMKAEIELKELEMRQKALLDNIPDKAWLKDDELKYIAVNEAFAKSAGGKPEDFRGKTDYEIWPGELARKYAEEDMEVVRSGKHKCLEEPLEDAVLGMRCIETIKTPIFDASGKVAGTAGIARDITERKKTEEELIKSRNETLFKNTLLEGQSEASIDGILAVDSEGKSIIQYNTRFLRMWNVPDGMVHSKDDAPLLSYIVSKVKEPDRFLEKVRYLYEHPEEKSRDEIETIDGRTFERYSSPLIDPNGKNPGRIWYFHEITILKKVENELRESKRWFADIISFLPDATLVIDKNGVVTAWNKAVEEMTGIKAENIIGRGDYEYSLGFYNERRPILIDMVLKQSPETEKKYSMLTSSNNAIIGEAHVPVLNKDLWGVAVALYDANGNIAGAIESIRDITDRKRIDNALKVSEAKFKTFFNSASDAFFIIDPESRILEANQIACDVLGYTKEEMKDFMVEDITGDGSDFFKEKLKSTFESGSLMFECMHKRKDGTFIPVEVNGRVIDYEGKKAVLSISRDIAERKKYEEKLRRAYNDLNEELKRQEAISNISSVYLSLEKFEESTKKALRIVGEVSALSMVCIFENDPAGGPAANTSNWHSKDMIALSDGLGLASLDDILSFKKLMHEKGAIMVTDTSTLPEDLSKALLMAGIRSIFVMPLIVNKESYGYIAYCETREQRDWDHSDIILLTTVSQIISEAFERKISDEQLKKRNEEVEKSQRVILNINEDLKAALETQKRLEKIKTEFLSVTSHELRTPITPMKAQLQMVLGQYFGTLTNEQKTSLEMVLRNTTRLDHLICDILDISKLESGNMKFIVATADLNELIKNAVETLKYNANEKSITIDAELENMPQMSLDKDRITEVIMNLITNAVKFTDPGGHITIKTKNDKDKATVEVTDNGIGIKEEDIKKLFNPFFQVDSSRSRNHEGTGLGLAICKGIIINHGGEINVKSTPGQGSTFYFTIPYNETISSKVVKEVELFKLK